MLPARPPLPTPWNLPFHWSVGIQTSNLIAGATVPATRQMGTVIAPMVGYVPGATDCASVMLVSGSESFARSAQATGFAACAETAPKETTDRIAARAAA